ncbi:MAG: rRNA maturation RNase YbeY [Bacteroidales bacterium]|nr:rRNA maturation RNase YbeY [Bacteroidales bacterium]
MKVHIEYLNSTDKKIALAPLQKWIKSTLESENKRLGEIQIVITNDNHLQEINKIYLKHDYFTDVIAFGDNRKNIIYGEIYISYECIERNAKRYSVNLLKELLRVIIHGVLHLAGYNDKSYKEKIEMKEKEEYYLRAGIIPYINI